VDTLSQKTEHDILRTLLVFNTTTPNWLQGTADTAEQPRMVGPRRRRAADPA
jgi:hypothetical protein